MKSPSTVSPFVSKTITAAFVIVFVMQQSALVAPLIAYADDSASSTVQTVSDTTGTASTSDTTVSSVTSANTTPTAQDQQATTSTDSTDVSEGTSTSQLPITANSVSNLSNNYGNGSDGGDNHDDNDKCNKDHDGKDYTSQNGDSHGDGDKCDKDGGDDGHNKPPCTLSAADFHDALDNGDIIANPIVVSSDGKTGSFTLTNNTSCSGSISLSSYKMFVSAGAPHWLSTQVLFDSAPLTLVAKKSTVTLTVQLPTCRPQIDSWYGNAPTTLLDSNPYTYPHTPFVLKYAFGPGSLCQNATSTNTAPTITLNGPNPLILTVGDVFVDPGAVGHDAEDGILTPIVTGGPVHTNATSTYTLVYTVTDSGGLSASTTRTVIVEASSTGGGGGGGGTNLPPVITLIGPNPLFLMVGDTFVDPGATTTDPQGATTTIIVSGDTVDTSIVSTSTVIYTAVDALGLSASTTRTVIVNASSSNGGGGGGGGGNLPPIITLLGPNPLILTVGDTFVDPGATTTDPQGATTTIIVSGDAVDTSIATTSVIIYTATDSLGLSASTTRTVIVEAASTGGGGGGGSSGNGGGGSSSGTYIGGGASSGSPVLFNASTPTPLTLNTCPLITTYMRLGADNDRGDVLRLQSFLQNVEQADVDVTGTFDQKTDTAVRAFQVKYLAEVMGPWDATQSSGYVYITTEKKINEIACNLSLTLTQAQIAIINAYVQNLANGTSSAATIGNGTSTPNTSTTSPLIGENAVGLTNTAAVGNIPILQRFWNFLVNLFHL